MKNRMIALMAAAILCAGCDQPTQPPPPKIDQPYTGIYQNEVNALEKAKQAGDAMQQSITEREQKSEQATQ